MFSSRGKQALEKTSDLIEIDLIEIDLIEIDLIRAFFSLCCCSGVNLPGSDCFLNSIEDN